MTRTMPNHPGSSRRTPTTTPLAQTHLQVAIEDLLARYELRHVFRNEGPEEIEAVYTFPVPLDAAFLGMEAVIGDQRRVAQVMPARQAARRYDDAIAEGDSAVLLERLEPGLLCVNLGNLKPGEDGEITLRFAAALGVSDRYARFSLPLVHRPRYGRSRLEDRVEPRSDFAVEHPLTAQIRVRGLLAGCAVQSTAQGTRFKVEAGDVVLDVVGALLDRDFVLVFDLTGPALSSARWIADDADSLGVVTFVPTGTEGVQSRLPLNLCLVMDGSGSMTGDAIAQSQHALMAVAESLDGDDRIQVLRFGSQTVPLFRRPLKASERVREALVDMAATVKADLGGTEIARALNEAMDGLEVTRSEDIPPVIILVTDGAVQPHEMTAAQERAMAEGIRIFVVAVGSSAGVDVLAPLAHSTRAALERAVPAEPVDEAVMRHLRRARMREPMAVEIDWGVGAEAIPVAEAYPGDAITAVARFNGCEARHVLVRVPQLDIAQTFAMDQLQEASAWRAWIGQQLYQHADDCAKADLALRYGLIADETSAVLVLERAQGEKAIGLPHVVPVDHMAPETQGHVVARVLQSPLRIVRDATPNPAEVVACMSISDVDALAPLDDLYLDIPAFMGRQIDEDSITEQAESGIDEAQRPRIESLIFVALLEALAEIGATGVLWERFMRRIPERDWRLVERYLHVCGRTLKMRSDALALMDDLIALGVTPHLDDELEATLSRIVIHRKRSRSELT